MSVDSAFSHLAWINQPRKQGGLGGLAYPLVADITKSISKDYGVLIEEGTPLQSRLDQVSALGVGVLGWKTQAK